MDDTTLTRDLTDGLPLVSPAADRVLRDLESYWQELSRSTRIPFRSDVDPRRIDAALPHAFVLQRVAEGVGRFRVAGAELETLLGMDPRGMPLSAFFTPAARLTLKHWFAMVFDRPALVELPLVSERRLGRPRLDGRLMILPLANEDGEVALAMGALVVSGNPGFGPRRFDIPDGFVRMEPAAAEVTRRPAPHAAARAAAIARGGRPDLRLVVDNT